MTLIKQQTVPTSPDNRELVATLRKADGTTLTIEGEGNGPIDAFVDALKKAFGVEFSFIDYPSTRSAGRQRHRRELCRDPRRRRPAAPRRRHRPEHRHGLAQGDA